MTSLGINAALEPRATSATVTDEMISVELADGRTISVPTIWYPRLKYATRQERANYEIDEIGISWPDVEADFSIRGILLGRPSGENPRCFKYWLDNRKQGRRVTVMDWLATQKKNGRGKRASRSVRRNRTVGAGTGRVQKLS
jgi:hypothetical protein